MPRFLVVFALVAVACRNSTAPVEPLEVSVETSAAVIATGDTLAVVVNAAGNNLIGVIVEYGDQQADQYATSGANIARVTFKHVFQAAGAYTIRAIVTDALAGEKEATVTVQVN